MKTFVLFLVIAATLAVNCSAQTVTTEKKLRPRFANMAVRQTEIDKALGVKEPYSYRASISPTRVSIQEKGERDLRTVYRTQGVNGAKDEITVAKTVWSVKYAYTNSVDRTPQMVDAQSTARAGTVVGFIPMKPILPKK